MAEHSKDYHDFVIKDGKLVGEFDQMYRKSETIPWHQDKEAFVVYSNIVLELVKIKSPYRNILDVGCGLGYFTERLKPFGKVTGIDVSNAAVAKANVAFPGIEFLSVDITDKEGAFAKLGKSKFDLVILKEIIWYIIHDFDVALDTIDSLLTPGGYLICSNFFPSMGEKYYGKEMIPSPERLRDIFTERKGYNPLYYSVMYRYEVAGEGPLVTIMYKKG